MTLRTHLVLWMGLFMGISVYAQQRNIRSLERGWKFSATDPAGAAQSGFNDSDWQTVNVPHDWAIYGPFDRNNDLQVTRIIQNGEQVATEKSGRTGGLPYMGTGWYRIHLGDFDSLHRRRVYLHFDGAMSHAQVFVNGKEAGRWPYGYNAFHFDITDYLNDTEGNVLAVRLENPEQSSRWYPGAGLYRHVRVVTVPEAHIPIWGTYVTTPSVNDHLALVRLRTKVNHPEGVATGYWIATSIHSPDGETVANDSCAYTFDTGQADQYFRIAQPALWSPEHPNRYRAVTRLYHNGTLVDTYETPFGIRSIAFDAQRGFVLNGESRKFKGVCNHHDLGPLGAALNKAALHRRLLMLKDMGADAIRTAHNMPSPELVTLCDELGFMLIVESFDEWKAPKMKNGYHKLFDEWAEKDLVNMIHAFRNNPSVIMWSIGNEVPDQHTENGFRIAARLQDICHREDPTRPVTVGMDQIDAVLRNGFAALLDVPGFNYKPHRYEEALTKLPQGFLFGAETASTVSSRGVYHFPAVSGPEIIHPDNHSSSYDLEYCPWSQTPEHEFIKQDDLPNVLGEFVWTGFDYLGEPTPYDEYWPSHSSYFGIIDLAGLPKDRYYLYRSRWNPEAHTLHLLPHWTWPGREGQITPVYCYTNHPAAELFVNGRSMGVRMRDEKGLQSRYRLMWDSVRYEPGTIRVVALDSLGKPAGEEEIHTAGKPASIKLEADRMHLKADGKDMAFITVSIVDDKGNLCPQATNEIVCEVEGAALFRAIGNGDPTNLQPFHKPQMAAFSGKLVITVQAGDTAGDTKVTVKAEGLKSAEMDISCAGI